MGLAFLPKWLVADDIAAGQLEHVLPEAVVFEGRPIRGLSQPQISLREGADLHRLRRRRQADEIAGVLVVIRPEPELAEARSDKRRR